jgi:uncharacterized membrane protein YqjE
VSVGDTDAGPDEPGPRNPGLRAALKRLAAAGLGLASTRAELLTVELTEERERLTQRLALVAAGGLMLAFGAMFAGAFVIVMFWDTHRLWAIALVAAAHLGVGAWLLVRARDLGRGAPPPFAASIAELRKDREMIERALGERDEAA